MKHVVNFSGGAGSWMTAKRVAERYGTDNLVLLCADTGSEADDWYDFVQAAAADVGGQLVMVSEEKYGDIWEQAFAKNLMPSIYRGWCTIERKIKPMQKWREANCSKDDTIIYFGYDWSEQHRIDKVARSHFFRRLAD